MGSGFTGRASAAERIRERARAHVTTTGWCGRRRARGGWAQHAGRLQSSPLSRKEEEEEAAAALQLVDAETRRIRELLQDFDAHAELDERLRVRFDLRSLGRMLDVTQSQFDVAAKSIGAEPLSWEETQALMLGASQALEQQVNLDRQLKSEAKWEEAQHNHARTMALLRDCFGKARRWKALLLSRLRLQECRKVAEWHAALCATASAPGEGVFIKHLG
jgi:hypothetical protein